MEILEGDQSQKLFNDYLICWRDFLLARFLYSRSRETKMGGGGGQLYYNFLKFPPQRERDRTSTHYQKLFYSVLTRIATALELGKVLM